MLCIFAELGNFITAFNHQIVRMLSYKEVVHHFITSTMVKLFKKGEVTEMKKRQHIRDEIRISIWMHLYVFWKIRQNLGSQPKINLTRKKKPFVCLKRRIFTSLNQNWFIYARHWLNSTVSLLAAIINDGASGISSI